MAKKRKPLTEEQRLKNNAGVRAYRAANPLTEEQKARKRERDREYVRAQRATNPEKWRERDRAYRAAMTEEQKARRREYDRARRDANREKVREHDRAYRAAMTEEQKARRRERVRAQRAANPERHRAHVREYSRAQRAANPAKELWNSARRRAKALGREFAISIQDIEAIWPAGNICPLLRVPMERKTQFAPSLDRIDNTKGYVVGNIMVVSKLANLAKAHATPDLLFRMACIAARATAKPGELPAFSRIELVDEFTLPVQS